MVEQQGIGTVVVLSKDDGALAAIREAVRVRKLIRQLGTKVEGLAQANVELLALQKQVMKSLG